MTKSAKKHKTFPLHLTVFELTHLRDLFSITLPPTLDRTVSQALAASEDRLMVEAKLWQKVAAACRESKIPMDDDAPDFICAASSAPPVGVFRLAQEPNEGEHDEDEDEDSSDESSVFTSEEVEETDSKSKKANKKKR